MGNTYSQMYPPPPTLTEKNLKNFPSQKGRVFIVTGGNSGIGFELCKLLYQIGAKIYIATRSKEKAFKAIEDIKAAVPTSPMLGFLEFLHLQLDDLSTIRASMDEFRAKEERLDVLWNNAGLSRPIPGTVSKQGHEVMMATNCLGPYLFTQLLLPCIEAAAETARPGSVRVIWTASQTVDLKAPMGGFDLSLLDTVSKDIVAHYVASKLGNWYLASEMQRRLSSSPSGSKITSIVLNPGNLDTPLIASINGFVKFLLKPLLHEARFGAYTELWAGLSSEVDVKVGGGYVIPWGRMHHAPRKDLLDALKGMEEGGTGKAVEFWEWCEKKTAAYRLPTLNLDIGRFSC